MAPRITMESPLIVIDVTMGGAEGVVKLLLYCSLMGFFGEDPRASVVRKAKSGES